jgi:hypothetical protein
MRKNRPMRKRSARMMSIESLENRSLMAGDLHHNFAMPEDVNANGMVTPLDAMIAVNRLNRTSGGPSATTPAEFEAVMVDVNADESISPSDALAVINMLNSRNGSVESGSVASGILPSRRMERIERAVETNSLPPGWTVDQAQAILETLRGGGRPELGDSIVDGSLRWMPDALIAPEDARSSLPQEDQQIEWFISAVSQRLAAFNVSPAVISDISTYIRDSFSADSPVDQAQVRQRLADMGVDVDTIMPQPKMDDVPSQPEAPEAGPIAVTGPILESILARLQAAGASSDIIAKINQECTEAIDSGLPLNLKDIQERLGELGFSWDNIAGAPPATSLPPAIAQPQLPAPTEDRERPEPPIVAAVMVTEPVAQSLLPRLADAGVSEEILDILRREIYDAIARGGALSMLQVRLRLQELGG